MPSSFTKCIAGTRTRPPSRTSYSISTCTGRRISTAARVWPSERTAHGTQPDDVIAGGMVGVRPFARRGHADAGAQVLVDDLAGGAVVLHPAVAQQDRRGHSRVTAFMLCDTNSTVLPCSPTSCIFFTHLR